MSGFSSSPGQARAFMGSGNPPSVVVQPALGSTGSASIEGNNVAGKITFTVSGINVATGKILSLTFADNMQFPTGATVNDMAGNDNYAAARAQLYAVATKTGIDLHVRGLALGAGTYVGYYQVIGY